MSMEPGLLVTIILAFLGYIVTYWRNIQISKRKEQLELIDKRISDFYGPLYVATQSAKRAYDSLLQKAGKEGIFFTDRDSPATEEDKKEWLHWMENVFMPNNMLIERLIIENAYLIQEEEMPECLLQFIAHVSGYKVNMARWKRGNYTETLSIIDYPQKLNEYIEDTYRELKAKQLRLIGRIRRS